MNSQPARRVSLIAGIILSITVVGYFTGLQSPVRPEPATLNDPDGSGPQPVNGTAPETELPATAYSRMPEATYARASEWLTSLSKLKSDLNPLDEVVIQPGDKETSLQARARNRAFNGAPPTIPHPIEQRFDRACLACHREGVKTTSLRIPRMSHQLLANCTQCHVESNPRHMAAFEFRDNDFTGLPAPTGGPRAFSAAPPMIPHTSWMRSDCLSCHGIAGQQGIRTTHPWRRNCRQCHAASTELDQSPLASKPQFLPAPQIESSPAKETNDAR